METPAIMIGALLQSGEAYTKTSIELAKLKSVEVTARVVTTLVARMATIIMVSIFVLVFNVGVALLLGDLLGKNYYGFFIVAGFYLILALILHFFLHSWIKKPISALIITQALQ